MYSSNQLGYAPVRTLQLGFPTTKPVLPQETYQHRFADLLHAMEQRKLDAFILYADREHAASFLFFTGVDPRFEEALLVVHADGTAYGVFGNECLSLAGTARIPVTGVFCQALSLPNQPMDRFVSMEQTMQDCGLRSGMRVGVADWKLFRLEHGAAYRKMYAIPAFLLEGILRTVGGAERVENATAMLIGDHGVRLRVDAASIAEMEFGATCASESVRRMLDAIEPGMSEQEIAVNIKTFGQPMSCHDYIVAGANTRRGLISPSGYRVQLGDDCVVSAGLQGGLTCRRGVVAYDGQDVPFDAAHYMESIVKPYLSTVFNWYEMIGIGVCCGNIYAMVESRFPKATYGWTLNPGHTTSYEEWMSAPIYAGSEVKIESGMLFQMDIIPSDPAYPTPNVEDGLAIADAALRAELARDYPEVYARITARRKFAQEEIGLTLKPEVLPLSNCFAEYRPYMLRRDKAIVTPKRA